MKALAKKPEQRYASVEEFADALEQASLEQQKRFIRKQTSAQVPIPIVNKQNPEIAVVPLRPNKSGFLPLRPSALTHPTIVSVRDNVDSTIDLPEKVIQLPAPPQPALSPNIQKSENTSPSFIKKYNKAALLIGLILLIVFGTVGFLSRPVIKSPQPSPVTATLSVTLPITLETAMFGFDAQHTRFNSFVNTLNPANVSSLALYWKVPQGGSISSSPVAVNGVVYVGSDNGKLYAFSASTGKTLWQATTGDSIESSPAVVDGIVYVGSFDHKLYAFDAYTGELLWRATAGGAIGSSPAIANGVVYVGANDGRLYAFNASGCAKKTCFPLWTSRTSGQIISPPMVANGVVYVGSWDGKLYAFGANRGTFLNTWTTGASIASQPFVANGIVYVSSFDGWLYAFHLPFHLSANKT